MIKIADLSDLDTLVELSLLLWSDSNKDELKAEYNKLLADKKSAFFIKYIDNLPVGFAHCQLRFDYVEGTCSSPVGYLEGIYVKDAYQRQGIARELVKVSERFAYDNGCREFASDCELDNSESLEFHKSLGFKEVNRIIAFVKEL